MSLPSPQNLITIVRRARRGPAARLGLTLVELLVTISIIAILAGLFLGGLFSAQESAKVMKTRAMIVKLNNLIMPRYESYRTRRVPISIVPFTYSGGGAPVAVRPQAAAKYRLDALHELMRMEMPDRMTDIIDPQITLAYPNANPASTTPISRPALSQAYYNALSFAAFNYNGNSVPIPAPKPNWNINEINQGAECLYMIVTMAFVDELGGRDLFNESNIGDTDGDGLPEFLDGWGIPIAFLRWCPGFTESELNGGGGLVSVAVNNQEFVAAGAPAGTSSYGLARRTGAYTGKRITFTSASAAYTPQTATVASSTYNVAYGTTDITLVPPGVAVAPSAGDAFGIDPYPFDPTHAYPNASQVFTGTTTQIVPFAIYPLIFSAGPDKTFGVLTDFGATLSTILEYAAPAGGPSTLFPGANNNFPFLIDNTSADSNFGQSMGTTKDITSEQQKIATWEASGWIDNIHNHMIGSR